MKQQEQYGLILVRYGLVGDILSVMRVRKGKNERNYEGTLVDCSSFIQFSSGEVYCVD